MSFPVYPSSYTPYGTAAYHPPSKLIPPFQQLPSTRLPPPPLQQATPSIFGTSTLPLELLQQITRNLSYLDVIRLSRVNRYLNAHVDPLTVSEQERVCFILMAEREYERYSLRAGSSSGPGGGQAGRDSGWLSCYHCFKIKGPAEFELFRYNGTEQPEESDTDASSPRQTPAAVPSSNPHYDPTLTRSSLARTMACGPGFADQSSPRVKETWGIRRFCIECGVKKGYYQPGSLIELRSDKPGRGVKGRRDDKESKEAKWICNCL